MLGGIAQKCQVCDKRVYLVEQFTADSKIYHKACFRCHHCKNTLKLNSYSSIDGVLYCKPHYDQLFKMTGSLDKSFEGAPKVSKDKPNGIQANSKYSSKFAGTKDKCVICTKTVYPLEKVAVDGASYHRACFKCNHGGCAISTSNFVAHEGKIYCKHHHTQLFRTTGDFSRLENKPENAKVASEKVSAEEEKIAIAENVEVVA